MGTSYVITSNPLSHPDIDGMVLDSAYRLAQGSRLCGLQLLSRHPVWYFHGIVTHHWTHSHMTPLTQCHLLIMSTDHNDEPEPHKWAIEPGGFRSSIFKIRYCFEEVCILLLWDGICYVSKHPNAHTHALFRLTYQRPLYFTCLQIHMWVELDPHVIGNYSLVCLFFLLVTGCGPDYLS